MKIEELILALIAALEANTAALTGGEVPEKPAASKPAAGGKPAAKPAAKPAKKAQEHTAAELKTHMLAIRDKHGKEAAVAILEAAGFAEMKDVDEDSVDKVWEAADAWVAENDF